MSGVLIALGLIIGSCGAAEQPEIVVVEGTFTVAKSPSEGRGAQQFCDKVEKALQDVGIAFTLATEEQVEQGVLAGYRLAIFPYSAHWSKLEEQKVVEFIEAGGKLMAFYTVPRSILDLLGVKVARHKRADYEGQYSQMRFVDDRPSDFPALVHQLSSNLQVCETTKDGRAIALWHDGEGKPTGTAAVILSEHGVYMSHVLHSGNAAEQSMFVLGVVGHFLPHIWQRVVEGAIAHIPRACEVDSMEALRTLVKGNRAARELVAEVEQEIAAARESLRKRERQDALSRARGAEALAENAVAATQRPRDGELRGVWAGGGANMDWEGIMATLQEAGFNAIFPLMCTGNHALYPSEALPQTGERDEMQLCVEAAKRHNIEVHVWRVNWCMLGGSAERRQQFVDDGRTMVSVTGKPMTDDPATGSMVWMCPSHEGNRQIEKRAMLELTRKYHPAGIHFDYMRFPSRDYCYCSRCREKFEQRRGAKVENWLADCFVGGKLFEEFKQFRKWLHTSLVQEIAEESRKIDPEVRISLAARSALPGAPENDGQDWPTWCEQGYLDFVCPMDYSGHDDGRLRRWVGKQLDTIHGSVPLYAGLGVTYRPTSLANAVRASKQIRIVRDEGADGFLVFSYNETFRQILQGLKLGATSQPTTMMPHHHPQVTLSVEMPPQPRHMPLRTWPPGERFQARLHVSVAAEVRQLTVRCDLRATDGRVVRAGEDEAVQGPDWRFVATGGDQPAGHYQWVAIGEAVLDDGARRPFTLRSRPWRVATEAEVAELRARASPPQFNTDKTHVGVLADGYGSQAILDTLSVQPDIEAVLLYEMSLAHLRACDVVVVPQRLPEVTGQFAQGKEALREYVRSGGGLLLTHDAVGMRQHVPVFPELWVGGPQRVRLDSAIVAVAHPITEALNVGESFHHSYADHIPVVVRGEVAIVVSDAEGNTVVAAGRFGKGRVVANGMCTGLGPRETEAAPVTAEKTLLINAVSWLAGVES